MKILKTKYNKQGEIRAYGFTFERFYVTGFIGKKFCLTLYFYKWFYLLSNYKPLKSWNTAQQ